MLIGGKPWKILGAVHKYDGNLYDSQGATAKAIVDRACNG